MTELEKLNNEIERCTYCPFMEYKFNGTKELGFGEKYRIAFIGSSPAVTSNKSSGNSKFDSFFLDLLAKVNISRKDFYFTNLVKTSIPNNVKPTYEQLKHCKSHVIQELLIVKPQVVILLGKIVREAFDIGYPGTVITKILLPGVKKNKAVFYTMAHPGTLHYEPEREEKYLRQLKLGLRFYKRVLI